MSPKKRRRGSGEGSIYQRKDGRWCAVVDLARAHGKRQRKTVTGRTRKEVAEKLKALHNQQAQGIKLSGGQQTIAQLIAWWMQHVVRDGRAPSTYRSYESLIRQHLDPTIGDVKVRELTQERCQELWNTLRATLAARSVRTCRSIVITVLDLAVSRGDVARNVARDTEAPPVERHEPPLADTEKAKRLRKAAQGERIEILFDAALETGARIGELLALRRNDLDLERRTLRIAGTMGRSLKTADAPSKATAGPTKGKEPRTLTISTGLATRLREQLVRVDAERAAANDWHEHGLVFPSERGTPLAQPSVGAVLKRVLERAGLEPMTFHALRHWSASLALAAGVNLAAIKQRLGHKTIGTTMDIYAHVIPQVEQDAADALGKLLEEGDKDESAPEIS